MQQADKRESETPTYELLFSLPLTFWVYKLGCVLKTPYIYYTVCVCTVVIVFAIEFLELIFTDLPFGNSQVG